MTHSDLPQCIDPQILKSQFAGRYDCILKDLGQRRYRWISLILPKGRFARHVAKDSISTLLCLWSVESDHFWISDDADVDDL
jgi:hypothetical protein